MNCVSCGAPRSRPRGARLAGALLALALFVSGSGPAIAAGAADLDTAQLETLVDTLEDDAKRRQFVDQLQALIAARRAIEREAAVEETLGARVLSGLSRQIERIGVQLTQTAAVLAAVPETVTRIAAQARQPSARALWLEIAGKLALVLALALVACALTGRLLARVRSGLTAQGHQGPISLTLLFLGRAVLAFVPLIAFAAIALVVLPLTEPRPATRILALGVINAAVLVQATLIVARLVLQNGGERGGLLELSAETAAYLVIWTRRLAMIGIFGYFAAETAVVLGLAPGAHAMLLKALGLVVAIMLVVLVLQNRHAVAAALGGEPRGDDAGRSDHRSRLAQLWHVPVLLYIAVGYGAWAVQAGNGFVFLARATVASAALVVIAILVLKAIRLVFDRGLRVSAETARRFPGLETRANAYFGIVRAVLAALTYLVAAMLLIEVWIGGSIAWLSSDAGQVLVARAVTIAFVLAAAAAVWEAVTAVVERVLSTTDAAGPGSRGTRLRTLLPLIRNAVRAVLGVIVVLTVLSELGIDIAPLLAGAGIAGLAIGFGAQSLVKDVITGIFILLEDSIAVGDVVEVGGHAGVVEAMSVRTVRLRDLSGSVHVVPFGEVASVLNMTKDFAFALMDVGVAYKEDVDQVIEVLKQLADEMRADADFAPMILEPLEVLGLESFGDSAVVIRVRLKTRPIKQWAVKREYQRRMKRRFDELGIEIPFPHRTIYYGDAGAPKLGAAASPAVDAPGNK